MEAWVPLFDIFLNSPVPESEASQWFHRSFNASSAATVPITTASFVSLLMKPLDAIVVDESEYASSSSSTRRVIYVQTLPNMVQARIFSFLAVEHKRFCRRDLCNLARIVLSDNQTLDFWVERAARHLLDAVSELNYEWISCLNLDSGEEESTEDEFESLPSWLKDATGSSELLPWLPISLEDLKSWSLCGGSGKNNDTLDQVAADVEQFMDEKAEKDEIDDSQCKNYSVGPEIHNKALSLKAQIMNFESTTKVVGLANEIRELCVVRKGDSSLVLGLIEPWLSDNETASVLISQLSYGSEEELTWPSQVICSIILPKFLVLKEPAPRVLLAATLEFCKLHQKTAVYALLLPLILYKNGINNPICDVITRVIKECLHPAHVSAFCQKLLCSGKDERGVICLPCHQHLISDEMVWTESLFNLFQSILNHNVCLTQDSVDRILYQVHHLAERFSKSLKFGNFLLCLVTKCSPLLKSHKSLLTEVVEKTNTLLTKSILSKLASM